MIKYQYKKFSYQIRKQDLIENLLNDRTLGCHEVKFPYLVGENRTEPKIIFFIYQNYWDILRLPILYFKCKCKKHWEPQLSFFLPSFFILWYLFQIISIILISFLRKSILDFSLGGWGRSHQVILSLAVKTERFWSAGDMIF